VETVHQGQVELTAAARRAEIIGFAAMAALYPDRTALIDPNGTTASYGDLASSVMRTAQVLRSVGVGRGDAFCVMAPNCAEFIETWAAGMLLGAYVIPVNWHLTAPEVEYMLADAQAVAIVAHERVAAAASAAAESVGLPVAGRLSIGGIPGFTPLDLLTAGQPDRLPGDASAGNPMFYTSGTTGRPKGIRKPLPDRPVGVIGVMPPAPKMIDGLPQAQDVVHLVTGPLYHAHPVAGAAAVLDQGGALVLMDKFDPSLWLELVAEHRVTHSAMVPTMFVRLLKLPEEQRRQSDMSSVVSLLHAGAPCPVEVKRRMIDWLGPVIDEYYSSSEGPRRVSIGSKEWLRKPGSVGKPEGTLKVYAGDTECAPGVPGTLYLEPAWSWNYHNDAEKTANAFRDGLFTVGDIGYLDEDGYLFLCDRTADLIISGGTNIYPAEVEAALLDHAAVEDVAVIGVPDEEWGESVRAVVQPVSGMASGDDLASELIAWCRQRLAGFKCPRAVDFVADLERDPNGKVRKHLIRARYWEGRERKI
jgi:long-chain acyl-CoA synthetase